MNINGSLSEYIQNIDKLRNLIRYQTSIRCTSESVAEHSYFVSAYLLKLKDYFNFDLEKSLQIALLHDFSETQISDIPHPIKQNISGLSEFLENAEYEVNKTYISEEFANWLEEFNKNSSPEGFVVILADILSVITYANREISLGNKFFKNVLYDTRGRYYNIILSGQKYLKETYTVDDILNEIDKISMEII